MFKAISRWGGYISNLFSSKSRSKYGEMCEDTEEIFSATHDEPFTDDDEDDDHKVVVETLPESSDGIIKVTSETVTTTDGTVEEQSDNSTEIKVLDENQTPLIEIEIVSQVDGFLQTEKDVSVSEVTEVTGDVTLSSSGDSSQDAKDNDNESISNCDNGDSDEQESEHEDDDVKHEHSDDGDHDHEHHHDHTVDTEQIIKSSSKDSKENGMPKSSSSGSIFQKVHRRVNSHSQRQYAKFDNLQDDENDNCIATNVDVVDATVTSPENKDADQIIVINEKKPKKKKKKKVALFRFIRGFFRRTNK